MASNITEPLFFQKLFPISQVIILPASTLMLLSTVYGIYFVVFGLSIRVFINQHDNPPPKLYLWGTISLFILDTIFVIFYAMGTIHQQTVSFKIITTMDTDAYTVYNELENRLHVVFFGGAGLTMVFMMILADSMLIHRCYVVWGFRRSILYPLVTISVIIDGVLLWSYALPLTFKAGPGGLILGASYIASAITIGAAVFNFLLTLMTVGCIWNITYKAQKIIGRSIRSRYKTIIAIIIESGVLFPSVLLATAVMAIELGLGDLAPIPIDLSVLSIQLAGLAPTMIIVRVAYSKPIESIQEMVSTLRFGNCEQQRPRSTIV